MKSILATLFMFITYLGAAASDPQPGEAASNKAQQGLQAFLGTWEIVTAQPPGSTKEAKRLVFRSDFTYAALDANNQPQWAGTFDLDPTAKPKIWDHRSNESKKNREDVLGIYELEGDRLKISCVAGVWKGKEWIGKPRPQNFIATAADVVLELRRVKSNDQRTPAKPYDQRADANQ